MGNNQCHVTKLCTHNYPHICTHFLQWRRERERDSFDPQNQNPFHIPLHGLHLAIHVHSLCSHPWTTIYLGKGNNNSVKMHILCFFFPFFLYMTWPLASPTHIHISLWLLSVRFSVCNPFVYFWAQHVMLCGGQRWKRFWDCKKKKN
jgi:hypothetical protein